MPRNNVDLPSASELRVLLDQEGLTHRELAARFGVSRNAITMKLRRPEPKEARVRHRTLLPWHVRMEHAMEYAPRMLRVEGRIRTGLPVPDREASRHSVWRERLRSDNIVVMYFPEHPDLNCSCEGKGGFHYVRREDAVAKYGRPHPQFADELIFVTRRQGDTILGRAA